MAIEAQLVIDVWEAVRDLLPQAKRSDAAAGIVRAMAEYGFEGKDLGQIVDEDDDLAAAFEHVFGDEDSDEDDE